MDIEEEVSLVEDKPMTLCLIRTRLLPQILPIQILQVQILVQILT